jgi:hypothetical protein
MSLHEKSEKHDLEAGSSPEEVELAVGEIERPRTLQNSNAVLRALHQSEVWLDTKLGVETQGIDRIPEEEKQPPSLINVSQYHSIEMFNTNLPVRCF